MGDMWTTGGEKLAERVVNGGLILSEAFVRLVGQRIETRSEKRPAKKTFTSKEPKLFITGPKPEPARNAFLSTSPSIGSTTK
tara:strand:- start:26 stop:271 length:246 start_codon:yes stop_codon:yes gene_type:complete